MKESEAKQLAARAMICPFCGEDLVAKNDHHGWWVAHREEPGDCFGSVIQLHDEVDLWRWNVRNGIEHDIQPWVSK